MKLTKQQLKQIIKEELEYMLDFDVEEEISDDGHSHTSEEFHDLLDRIKQLHEAWQPGAEDEVGLQYKQDLADVITDYGCGCAQEVDLQGSEQHYSVPSLPTVGPEPMEPPLAGSMMV